MGKRKETKKAITDIMNADAKDGLYAREHYSPTIQELFDETTPEELEKINKQMNQISAVEWLIQQINGHSYSIGLPYGMNARIDIPKEIIEQAKEMEKQQIINAFYGEAKSTSILNGEQYYNETYRGNK